MICTHPQVGQLQNHADRLHRPGVLKTIGEVFEVRLVPCCGVFLLILKNNIKGMRDQNWRSLKDDQKTKVRLKCLESAQIAKY